MELRGILLGGLIAGVAGLIGHLLTRNTEHRQWLRGQRQEKYSEFISIYHARSEVLIQYQARGVLPEDFSAKWQSYDGAGLLLVAPEAVALPVLKTVNALERAQNILLKSGPEEDFRSRMRTVNEHYRAALMGMRVDLQEKQAG
ncbi:hypothetical protein E8P82_04600 [Arthrobacter echini]|uniref:Uncharacterized protein n=1 Tax=Arthrobacter echini TaxID=1529066 RepID=A0A4S5E721_9MICC|nr:hypothetical protein [Arthrobacter echini]THJ67391.1 hypothetical protein E8P82_04600 [Arthrobacter echini]